jgi:hypothetical protein
LFVFSSYQREQVRRFSLVASLPSPPKRLPLPGGRNGTQALVICRFISGMSVLRVAFVKFGGLSAGGSERRLQQVAAFVHEIGSKSILLLRRGGEIVKSCGTELDHAASFSSS